MKATENLTASHGRGAVAARPASRHPSRAAENSSSRQWQAAPGRTTPENHSESEVWPTTPVGRPAAGPPGRPFAVRLSSARIVRPAAVPQQYTSHPPAAREGRLGVRGVALRRFAAESRPARGLRRGRRRGRQRGRQRQQQLLLGVSDEVQVGSETAAGGTGGTTPSWNLTRKQRCQWVVPVSRGGAALRGRAGPPRR